MRFLYLVGTSPLLLPSMAGGVQRLRPVLPVFVSGPKRSVTRDFLLDTGSDDIVLPDSLAPQLGIDLATAPSIPVTLAGRGVVVCRYAQLGLRISDGSETCEWDAIVGFVPVALRQPLLGFAGFFQFFNVEFRGAVSEFTITPSSVFPGRRF